MVSVSYCCCQNYLGFAVSQSMAGASSEDCKSWTWEVCELNAKLDAQVRGEHDAREREDSKDYVQSIEQLFT